MAMTAMIAVGFVDGDERARAAFAAHLDSLDWIQVPNVSSAWAANFPNAEASNPASAQAICDHAAQAVDEAAHHAGLREYHAAVQVGLAVPTLLGPPRRA